MATFKRAIDIKFKKLVPEAVIPSYAHWGDVGMDMTVTSVEYDVVRDEYIYGTGLACEADQVISMFCHPRSSIHKTNFYLTNHVGIVDCKTYRGEIKAIFKHRDSLDQRIASLAMKEWDALGWFHKMKPGSYQAIATRIREEFLEDPIRWAPYQVGEKAFQFWLCPIRSVNITETTVLTETDRGEGGFGSTDNK